MTHQATNKQVVKRPVTAFFAKKNAQINSAAGTATDTAYSYSNTLRGGLHSYGAPRSSHNVDHHSNTTGYYLSARNHHQFLNA